MKTPTHLLRVPVILVAAAVAAAAMPSAAAGEEGGMPDKIGPVPIRLCSGNLSVSEFMAYWGTGGAGQFSGATPEQNALLKRCSVSSMCDYLAWCLIEKERGSWDFSFYLRNRETLEKDGLGWHIFAWLHFPPTWFEDDPRCVWYRNLATGETIPQLSLWNPFTLQLYDEFYRRLAQATEGRLDFIRLAMPSEYGEIGYCAGMTSWLRPQPSARPGYWCGDDFALAHFRRFFLERYRTLDALNAAWGTRFAAEKDIAPPDVSRPPVEWRASEASRRRWLDFADWYNDSWREFLAKAVPVVRRHFPDKEIIISLGYGSEALPYGNDQSRFIAEMRRLGLSAQTPGDIGYFATRRVSSACRAYGVPYYTEPPGDVPRERQISRLWMDASNGTRTWFDYPQNLDRARDIFARYANILTGEGPVCSLAIWLPTAHHWLRPEEDWPRQTLDVANAIRPWADYEVTDDRMLREGALERLGVRTLVLAEADPLDASSYAAVRDWVKKGGVLIVLTRVASVTGGAMPEELREEGPAGEAKTGEIPEDPDSDPSGWWRLWEARAHPLGKGFVLHLPEVSERPAPVRAAVAAHFHRHICRYAALPGAAYVDTGKERGLLATLFRRKTLLYNPGEQAVRLRVRIFPEGGKDRPPLFEEEMDLGAREIRAVSLRGE